MNAHAAEFGLVDFHDVNNEPWHVQPSELPHSRSEFEKQVAPAMAALEVAVLAPAVERLPPRRPRRLLHRRWASGGGAAFSGIGY
jgi:hypothetical protein